MSWEGLGGTLNPGQNAWWEYWWDGYHGEDIARARPLNPGSVLRVFDPGERLENERSFHYFVRVRNDGPFPVNYHLTGTS
jgi:hypothetical protein